MPNGVDDPEDIAQMRAEFFGSVAGDDDSIVADEFDLGDNGVGWLNSGLVA